VKKKFGSLQKIGAVDVRHERIARKPTKSLIYGSRQPPAEGSVVF